MEINKYITILTFIPWLVIFLINTINNLNNFQKEELNFKYFKKNFFNIFRLDTLFLIIVFYYFASYNKDFVSKYLFAVMCLYLCVNSIYEKKKRLANDFFQQNLMPLILIFLGMLIPFFIYFFKANLILSYKIMLIYLFIEPIFILVFNLILKVFVKKN